MYSRKEPENDALCNALITLVECFFHHSCLHFLCTTVNSSSSHWCRMHTNLRCLTSSACDLHRTKRDPSGSSRRASPRCTTLEMSNSLQESRNHTPQGQCPCRALTYFVTCFSPNANTNLFSWNRATTNNIDRHRSLP